jgi:hypothetical protein
MQDMQNQLIASGRGSLVINLTSSAAAAVEPIVGDDVMQPKSGVEDQENVTDAPPSLQQVSDDEKQYSSHLPPPPETKDENVEKVQNGSDSSATSCRATIVDISGKAVT